MQEYNYQKLQELHIPYTFKNWREIMEYVGAPRDLAGNSKVKFQNNVKCYVDLHKGKGNEIIIDNIKNKVELYINTQGSRYQGLSIPLISHVLMTNLQQDYTINTLAEKIGCINDRYADANRHKKKTAKQLNIKLETVEWFFDSMNDRIKNVIVSSLDKMEEAGIIQYKVLIKGKYHKDQIVDLELKYNEKIDEDEVDFSLDKIEDYRFLSMDEMNIYDNIINELFTKYNISGEHELYCKDRVVRNNFYKEKKKIIFEKLNYMFTFKSYIIEPILDLKYMKDNEFKEKRLELNSLISTGFRDKIYDIISKEKENFNNLCILMEGGFLGDSDTNENYDMVKDYIEKNREKYTYNESEQKIDDREMLTTEFVDITFKHIFNEFENK